jgi:hypothetical protein
VRRAVKRYRDPEIGNSILSPLFTKLLVTSGIALCFAIFARANSTKDCHIGSYRLAGGRTVDEAVSDDDTLRWVLFTGRLGQLHPAPHGAWTSTYGWANHPDGKIVSFSDCGAGQINFEKETGERIEFDVSSTTFERAME